jgi:hypothetical protein
MATPNPEYKENWEELHDHHAAERDRLQKEFFAIQRQQQELVEAGEKYDSYKMEALYKKSEKIDVQLEEHLELCKRCLDTYQHKTIEDAAKWLSDNFSISRGSTGNTISALDLTNVTTISALHQAWADAHEAQKAIESRQRHSLPVGQPDGKDIFEKSDNNDVFALWHIIKREEHSPRGGLYQTDVPVPMTVDAREDAVHVCFAQDPDHRGTHIETIIERAATLFLYQQALVQGKKANEVDHNKFHFYIHHPPTDGLFGEETFSNVQMSFINGQYQNPTWHRYDVIPETVQSNYYALKEGGTDYGQAFEDEPKPLPPGA